MGDKGELNLPLGVRSFARKSEDETGDKKERQEGIYTPVTQKGRRIITASMAENIAATMVENIVCFKNKIVRWHILSHRETPNVKYTFHTNR